MKVRMNLAFVLRMNGLFGKSEVTMLASALSSAATIAAPTNLPATMAEHASQLYARNIQLAELNALCAVMAVIKWKKLCGFYADDDLIVGAADPFQLFRIMVEVVRGGGLDPVLGANLLLLLLESLSTGKPSMPESPSSASGLNGSQRRSRG